MEDRSMTEPQTPAIDAPASTTAVDAVPTPSELGVGSTMPEQLGDRLSAVERRLENVEGVIEEAKTKLAAFASGPAAKMLGALGLKL